MVERDCCDALRAEVRRLNWRLEFVEREVARMARIRPALDPLDRDWLASLLPAIFTATRGNVWALPDLAALALVPGNEPLAAAIAPHTGRAGGFISLGKALARCAGHAVDGFELRRVGTARDGRLWQCVSNLRDLRAANCAAADVDRKMIATLSD